MNKKRVFLARDPLAYFPKHRVACSSDISPDNRVVGVEEYVGSGVDKKLLKKKKRKEAQVEGPILIGRELKQQQK